MAAAPFTVTNLPASDIAADSAQVNGIVNPSGKAARWIFQKRLAGTKKRFLRATTWQPIPKGQTNVEVSAVLSGLAVDTTYEYRLVAMRGTVRKVSSPLTFTTTVAGPSVLTGPANSIANTSATLTGTVTPAGDDLTAFFEYGTTTGYGTTTSTVNVGGGGGATDVNQNIGGLQVDTVYHYRLVATNGSTTLYGVDQTFRTTVSAPVVTTLPASLVSASGGTLNGTVNPNGAATTAQFEWGTTTAYGNTTPSVAIPAGSSAVPVSASLSGLTANTTYHYRVVAMNNGGRSEGADATFTPQPIVTVCTEAQLRAAMQAGGTVMINCDTTIALENTIVVSQSVTLDASGHTVTISGGGNKRIFTVNNGVQFSVLNLTLADGAATAGGAIWNNGGAVTLTGVTLRNNTASTGGGAIANNGTLVLSQCSFANNQAVATSTAEVAGNAFGGAVHNMGGGTVQSSGCSYLSNVAVGGDALSGDVIVLAGGNAEGGAVYNEGAFASSADRFSLNRAVSGSGASLTQAAGVGQSGTTGSAAGTAVGGAISHRGVSLALVSGTFTTNQSRGAIGGTGGTGGGAFVNNTAGTGGTGGAGGAAEGGALFASGGAATVNGCVFAYNISGGGQGGAGGTGGGGIQVFGGKGGTGGKGGSGLGAAIYAEAGACNVTNSTLAINGVLDGDGGAAGNGAPCNAQALSPGAGGNGGVGGEAYGGAIYITFGSVSISHSTIAYNEAEAGVGAPGASGINGCFGQNSPNGLAGAAGEADGAVFKAVNQNPQILASIVANNSVAHQIVGAVLDLGHNISSDNSGFTDGTSLLSTNPLLGALANNGGPTLTIALQGGSPAINAADGALAPATDQRGVTRPQGPAPDIGAFEVAIDM